MAKKINVVLQGGGVKGVAFVGALSALEGRNDVEVEGVAGASAGAIVASLYAAGYSPEEMRDELEEKPLHSLVRSPWSPAWALYWKKGVYSTALIEGWLSELFARKNVQTFSDLQKPCRIIAANVTDGRYEVYREGAGVSVVDAVMQSLSIPVFFQPFRSGERLFVDGGLLSNYPLFLFEDSDLPVVGLKLVGRPWVGAKQSSSLFEYLKSLLATMLTAHDSFGRGIPGDVWEVPIEIGDELKATDFEIDDLNQRLLYENGRAAIGAFNWADIPTLRRVRFRDPKAVQILDAVTDSLDKLFEKRANAEREFLSYHQTFRVRIDGSVDEECQFVLRNHGPEAITVMSFSASFDVDVDASFWDLQLTASCEGANHAALVLPQHNAVRIRKYLVAFVPPIGVGDQRNVTIRSTLPKFLPFYVDGDRDCIHFHANHEKGIGNATLAIELDGSLPEMTVVDLRGASAGIATRSEHGRVAKYTCADVEAPTLDLKVTIEPKH